MAQELSTAGVLLKYAAASSGTTRPTSGYTTIPGVKEDVCEIVLNVKGITAKLHTNTPKTVIIDVTGARDVTAGDIKQDSDIEILNPDHHIATLSGMPIFPSHEFESAELLAKDQSYFTSADIVTSGAYTIKEINAEGGIASMGGAKLEAIYADSQSDATVGVTETVGISKTVGVEPSVMFCPERNSAKHPSTNDPIPKQGRLRICVFLPM